MFKTVFAASAVLLGCAAAQAEQMTNEQLMAELQSLRAEVSQLRAAQGDDWMNQRRAEEIKTLVREVLSDADTRASLMDSELTAGHNGKHFYLASADGNFTMEIGGQIQVRYVANWRDEDRPAGQVVGDQGESGFQLRRTKVYFEGTVINPRVHYAVQIAAARDNQMLSTDKVVIGYDLTDDLYIWAGEDKAPFLREELISSKRQLAVDRSLVNEAFTLDKVQGIGAKWNAHEQVKLAGMVHDGTRSGEAPGDDWIQVYDIPAIDNIANVQGASSSKDFDDDATDIAITARVDVLLAGDWKQWKDFSSWPGEELFAYVGAAINYEIGESGDTFYNNNYLSWTVDAGVEYQGFSAFIAYIGASSDFDDGMPGAAAGGADDFDPWGLVVQGSYNIDLGNQTSLEPFIRYEYISMDDWGNSAIATPATQDDDASLMTFGANWYHAKHNAKLTADIVWALDPLHSNIPGVSTGIGLLNDADQQEDQIALRLQYQLLF